MNSKSFLILLASGLFISRALSAEPLSPEQAAIDQFKACVKTAISHGTATEQLAEVCSVEKATLDERVPNISDQILIFLINGQ